MGLSNLFHVVPPNLSLENEDRCFACCRHPTQLGVLGTAMRSTIPFHDCNSPCHIAVAFNSCADANSCKTQDQTLNMQRLFQTYAESKVSLLVFMNAILIGAQTDFAAQNGGASPLTCISTRGVTNENSLLHCLHWWLR